MYLWMIWLVVEAPWNSQRNGRNKSHVPNHQPDYQIHRCVHMRHSSTFAMGKDTWTIWTPLHTAQGTRWLRERTHGRVSSLNLCLGSTDQPVLPNLCPGETGELNQGAIGTACRNCMFCIVAINELKLVTWVTLLSDPWAHKLQKKVRVNGPFDPRHLTPATA